MAASGLVALAILLSIAPVLLAVVVLLATRAGLPLWRRRLVGAGATLTLLGSLAMPIFFLALAIVPARDRTSWLPSAAGWMMVFAMMIAPIAAVLVCFGRKTHRIFGVAASAIVLGIVYLGLRTAGA